MTSSTTTNDYRTSANSPLQEKSVFQNLNVRIKGRVTGLVVANKIKVSDEGTSIILTVDVGSKKPKWVDEMTAELNNLGSSTWPIWQHDDNDTMKSTYWLRVRVPMKFLDYRLANGTKKTFGVYEGQRLAEEIECSKIAFLVWRPQYDRTYDRVSFTVSRINRMK